VDGLAGCDVSDAGYIKGGSLDPRLQSISKRNARNILRVWREAKDFVDIYYPDVKVTVLQPKGLKELVNVGWMEADSVSEC